MKNEQGEEEMSKWKLLRSITIPTPLPADGTDENGITWANKSSGGVHFAFSTDKDGNAFDVTEVIVKANSGCTYSTNTEIHIYPSATPVADVSGGLGFDCNKTNGKVEGWSYGFIAGITWFVMGTQNKGGGNNPFYGPRSPRTLPAQSFTSMCFSIGQFNGLQDCGFESGSTFDIYGR